MLTDPESEIRLDCLFVLSGSLLMKAARKTLVKLTPGVGIWRHRSSVGEEQFGGVPGINLI